MRANLGSVELIKADKYKVPKSQLGDYSFLVSHAVYNPEGVYVGSFVIQACSADEPAGNSPHSACLRSWSGRAWFPAGFACEKDRREFIGLLEKGELPDVYTGSKAAPDECGSEDRDHDSGLEVTEGT